MKKRHEINREGALEQYEECQFEIERLLKQIQAGLLTHDRNPSGNLGGHHWGHVGDLKRIETELRDIRDRLTGKGEYAKPVKTHRTFNRKGEAVEASIPS